MEDKKEKRKICIPEAQYRQGVRDRERLKILKELQKKINKILGQIM